ncbi:GPW/gp25 family protein [Actinoplanes sp. NPDC023714]|uniref:GPW/gp25 family protein n=1 Tax=Actinoplanes sp. NPDC023714 TaxID=3154322 RepID=UPI003411DD29
MTSDDFRGTGWRFPIVPLAGGGLGYSRGDDNITDSLLLLLRTAAGERVMRPELGTTVPDLIFEPGSEQNRFRLEQVLLDTIRRWEPRVEVESVVAGPVSVGDGVAEVAVTYRILRTNTRRNLVFPFYLADGGAVEL